MRKEIVARIEETNIEMEQLREKASQCSTTGKLNEVFRTQLYSMQQELNSIRFQGKKERRELEEKLDKLKTDFHNEKSKCKRLEEEKFLNNDVTMKLKNSLKKAVCDKQCNQQQLNDIKVLLALTE